jgi:hypothetical protein
VLEFRPDGPNIATFMLDGASNSGYVWYGMCFVDTSNSEQFMLGKGG